MKAFSTKKAFAKIKALSGIKALSTLRALKLLFTSLLLLTINGCATAPSQVEYLTYVKTGDSVPVSRFVDTQGNTLDLSESKNNKLLILFATWCSDSQRTMKHLAGSDLHLSPNVDIIGIGREESNSALDKFATEYELNFPLVADTDRQIYAQFANAGIPRLILLDANNKVVKTIIGETENTITKVVW
ncbi:TlpA family protein disulfide reductase [Shewanella pealeana]|uniref:Redoxin domain protein n=1 Tax=Shewanella pealeana (strain ATCC 700345 / ANG-SQ1) TaxID=398579 RepID=A8GZW6_SHEPA|nr:TlpA disulfide reductase family protein [Shewanella pealeana]ABV85853.1 Redoxin domain protein [Shewanella pealeana ATCC 700345]